MRRVVTCPYCSRAFPEPSQIGLAQDCSCGAVFAAAAEDDLGVCLTRLVSRLFQETANPGLEMLESCQVTVYRNFKASLPHRPPRNIEGMVREVRFSPAEPTVVNLIWVVRQDAEILVERLDQG